MIVGKYNIRLDCDLATILRRVTDLQIIYTHNSFVQLFVKIRSDFKICKKDLINHSMRSLLKAVF